MRVGSAEVGDRLADDEQPRVTGVGLPTVVSVDLAAVNSGANTVSLGSRTWSTPSPGGSGGWSGCSRRTT